MQSVARACARGVLRLSGWRFEGAPPKQQRFVCVAAPHTSYWDGVLLVLLAQQMGLRLHWMVKSSLVVGPWGRLLRRLGAIPVDRSGPHDLVEQMAAEFRRRTDLVLAIPPEGSRSKVEYWKSGFYHIALAADVPVVPGYLDFATRTAGLGPPVSLSGSPEQDMDTIRAFYRKRAPRARHVERFGPIRLREE